MAFPSNPSLGDVFTIGVKKYLWNGSAWVRNTTIGILNENNLLGNLSVNLFPAYNNAFSLGNVTFNFSNTFVSDYIGNSITIGNVFLSNTNSSLENANFYGLTYFEEIVEPLIGIQFANNIVTHNYNLGPVFYHSNLTNNFTADFVNIPTTNDRAISLTLILKLGATPYYCNAVRIDGVTQTVYNSQDIINPLANNTVTQNFLLLRSGTSWHTLQTFTKWDS